MLVRLTVLMYGDTVRSGRIPLIADAILIKEIAITVTDSTTGEKFTIYIQAGTSWNANTPSARVAYGDVGEYYGTGYRYKAGQYNSSDTLEYDSANKGVSSGEYNTALFGTSFVNRARNHSGWMSGGFSTNIGFDPITKQIYGYVYGSILT